MQYIVFMKRDPQFTKHNANRFLAIALILLPACGVAAAPSDFTRTDSEIRACVPSDPLVNLIAEMRIADDDVARNADGSGTCCPLMQPDRCRFAAQTTSTEVPLARHLVYTQTASSCL